MCIIAHKPSTPTHPKKIDKSHTQDFSPLDSDYLSLYRGERTAIANLTSIQRTQTYAGQTRGNKLSPNMRGSDHFRALVRVVAILFFVFFGCLPLPAQCK